MQDLADLLKTKQKLDEALLELEKLAEEQKEVVKEYLKELEEIKIKQIKNKLNI